MALYVNTNVSSLNAQRMTARATKALDVSYQRLSSGLRINSAKDDAAGLQISDRLTTQINGLGQGNRNAQDGISYAQTAEGALEETTSMLQRIRVLALQAANGTNTSQDRDALQQEVDALNEEIVRISRDTTFAGQDLLNGKAGVVMFQVGADANSIISVDLSMGFDTSSLAAQAADISGETFTIEPSEDFAGGTFNYTDVFKYVAGGGGIDITSFSKAEIVLGGIDALINAIDSKRAELGAVQNRLESTIRNQSNVQENVSSARSQIRDTDWAAETANLTQQQILQQASSTILTQANTRPQIALSLLQQ
ncbi:MAG: flagellin [Proteobacteria bacterium]|uniref:Flagellin n=1 Tax=Candidatus Avisuccinivibrio stercorigallinarum TaxID=2840704 RepID=A0A9D9DBX9_9GAMM|nr:flagellin [Candidatus Avisuccinivibrio stercorigallinarum]